MSNEERVEKNIILGTTKEDFMYQRTMTQH